MPKDIHERFRKKEMHSLVPELGLLLKPKTQRPWSSHDVGGRGLICINWVRPSFSLAGKGRHDNQGGIKWSGAHKRPLPGSPATWLRLNRAVFKAEEDWVGNKRGPTISAEWRGDACMFPQVREGALRGRHRNDGESVRMCHGRRTKMGAVL